ncbi:MAG: hypothetical protein GQ534_00530, partial [Candidatus Delongbacteria bacterium]|nr:hypothetical protein [Candidatus Delongbacteria bacterium]
MRKSILIMAMLVVCNILLSVSFTEDVVSGLIPMERSCAAWGDYDNDGDQDLLITGSDGGSSYSDAMTKLYRNDGGNNFTEIETHNLPQIFGRFDWGDYDNDGDLDIALTGTTYDSENITAVYNYDAVSGSFTPVT